MTRVQEIREISTDLAIIGTGLAGIAASVFAVNRGLSCSLAGNTGAVAYTTGYLDLLGFMEDNFISNPWQGIENLKNTNPSHPLATISIDDIDNAFKQFISFIGQFGIGYSQPTDHNLLAITPAGTLKPTFCVPLTMQKGVIALEQKAPCTILGFHGLKGFSAFQIAANLKNIWPQIVPKVVRFPGNQSGELYAEVAARSLEVEANRVKLAEIICQQADGSKYVGLPAVLGMHRPDSVLRDLEQKTGLSLFEIPTMPPSVPGIRLREMFEQVLPKKGMTLIPQQKVKKISFDYDRIHMELSDNYGPIRIASKTAMLATGRFLSGGLYAHFDHVAEPLINLPVHQPASRQDWYQEEYLDSRGHDIHLAGLETDAKLRPLGKDGKVFDPRLFAAGIILAHQDWIRQRCGAGIAIATAYKAVEAAEQQLKD